MEDDDYSDEMEEEKESPKKKAKNDSKGERQKGKMMFNQDQDEEYSNDGENIRETKNKKQKSDHYTSPSGSESEKDQRFLDVGDLKKKNER